jgi:putative SOS response-associated peptidase YedK
MCGRFTLTADALEFQRELELGDIGFDWTQRYNVAPTQQVAVVIDSQMRSVVKAKWGLVPFWAKDESIGTQLINARSETLQIKPAFRNAFSRRRCLILADGFYEWKKDKLKKSGSIPYFFHLNGRKPFAFAGLWELWKSSDGQDIRTCTIITCAANELVKPIHERMPVILSTPDCWKWLDSQLVGDLLSLLKPYPEEKMSTFPVSRLVNRAEIDRPECTIPLAS